MLLEELGAFLHPEIEFYAGKQHTHVQNRTLAVLSILAQGAGLQQGS